MGRLVSTLDCEMAYSYWLVIAVAIGIAIGHVSDLHVRIRLTVFALICVVGGLLVLL